MDIQLTLPSFTRTISNVEIEAVSATLIAKTQQALASQASSYLEQGITTQLAALQDAEGDSRPG